MRHENTVLSVIARRAGNSNGFGTFRALSCAWVTALSTFLKRYFSNRGQVNSKRNTDLK